MDVDVGDGGKDTVRGCSVGNQHKWPVQGKDCHLLTKYESTSFVSQQKGSHHVQVLAVEGFILSPLLHYEIDSAPLLLQRSSVV